MSKLAWDEIGERIYETGVSNAVLYPRTDDGKYPLGVAWNGVTNINESPSGAEPTPLYADNIEYLNILSTEKLGVTIEAYTYPDEFAECDGTAEISTGVQVGQQVRKMFGLVYKTIIGNDVENNEYGYKIHLIYGCLASPSDKGYSTVNDTPEAITFSWGVTTSPVNVKGLRPAASLTIDSTKIDKDKLKMIEDNLFGTDAVDGTEAIQPHLLLPDEITSILAKG